MRGRAWKSALALALALVSMGSICGGNDNRITGTYRLNIVESQDNCDNRLDAFGSVVTIRRESNQYVVAFGDEGTLTGDFNDEGILVAQGTIEDLGDGRTTTMIIGIIIRQGQITAGSGRLTFNGTFPGRTETCIQEFTVTGRRNDSAVPILG